MTAPAPVTAPPGLERPSCRPGRFAPTPDAAGLLTCPSCGAQADAAYVEEALRLDAYREWVGLRLDWLTAQIRSGAVAGRQPLPASAPNGASLLLGLGTGLLV